MEGKQITAWIVYVLMIATGVILVLLAVPVFWCALYWGMRYYWDISADPEIWNEFWETGPGSIITVIMCAISGGIFARYVMACARYYEHIR